MEYECASFHMMKRIELKTQPSCLLGLVWYSAQFAETQMQWHHDTMARTLSVQEWGWVHPPGPAISVPEISNGCCMVLWLCIPFPAGQDASMRGVSSARPSLLLTDLVSAQQHLVLCCNCAQELQDCGRNKQLVCFPKNGRKLEGTGLLASA